MRQPVAHSLTELPMQLLVAGVSSEAPGDHAAMLLQTERRRAAERTHLLGCVGAMAVRLLVAIGAADEGSGAAGGAAGGLVVSRRLLGPARLGGGGAAAALRPHAPGNLAALAGLLTTAGVSYGRCLRLMWSEFD